MDEKEDKEKGDTRKDADEAGKTQGVPVDDEVNNWETVGDAAVGYLKSFGDAYIHSFNTLSFLCAFFPPSYSRPPINPPNFTSLPFLSSFRPPLLFILALLYSPSVSLFPSSLPLFSFRLPFSTPFRSFQHIISPSLFIIPPLHVSLSPFPQSPTPLPIAAIALVVVSLFLLIFIAKHLPAFYRDHYETPRNRSPKQTSVLVAFFVRSLIVRSFSFTFWCQYSVVFSFASFYDAL